VAPNRQIVGETEFPLYVLYVVIEYSEQTQPTQLRIHSCWPRLATIPKNTEILAAWKDSVEREVGLPAGYVSQGFATDNGWWK